MIVAFDVRIPDRLRRSIVRDFTDHRIDRFDVLIYDLRMARIIPISVVETPEFLAVTRKMMTEEQRKDLVDYLAYHPTSGDLIQGSGGVRKLRWGLEGRGKRGGARVIYFYHHPWNAGLHADRIRQK